jgi:hypothetical protein
VWDVAFVLKGGILYLLKYRQVHVGIVQVVIVGCDEWQVVLHEGCFVDLVILLKYGYSSWDCKYHIQHSLVSKFHHLFVVVG